MDGEPDDELNVDVWTYQISGEERCGELLEILSGDERERYARFHFERHRHEYLCAHVLLRLALSRNEDVGPETWTFATGRWGKPYLAGAKHTGAELQFNLSHTAGFVACAIARGFEVGLDVEKVDRVAAVAEIARRFFSRVEAEYVERLSGDAQRDAFFRIWTLKEAYVKASGRGFDLPLREFWFEFENGGIRVTPSGPWKFWELQPAADYRLAVAALGSAKTPNLNVLNGGELL